MNITGLS